MINPLDNWFRIFRVDFMGVLGLVPFGVYIYTPRNWNQTFSGTDFLQSDNFRSHHLDIQALVGIFARERPPGRYPKGHAPENSRPLGGAHFSRSGFR